ncbi:MAG: LuxR C-terminal-related transcriptional regulator [Tepidiformaceae bacterium]
MSSARHTGPRPHAPIEWSHREREVLDLIARGRTNGEIAETLCISFPTAKWHVSELISKLGVSSREAVAEYWRYECSVRGRASRLFGAIAGFGMLKLAGGAAAVAIVGGGAGIGVLAFGGTSGSATTPAVSTPTPAPSATPAAVYTQVNLAEQPQACWSRSAPPSLTPKQPLLCDYHNYPEIVAQNKGAGGQCDLRDATLPVFMASIDLSGCDLRGANLSMLNHSNLAGTNLAGNQLSGGTFAGVDFTGANLSGIVANPGVFSTANFTDANLTNAEIDEAIVVGAIWSNTTCPDGTNSDQHNGTCVGTPGLVDPPTTYAGH